jgi:lysophospholipase L1-like esterase
MITTMLFVILSCTKEKIPTIYTIGDSTMASYKQEKYPKTGWCQALPQFFSGKIIVKNHAVSGRSSKSFINDGYWQEVLKKLSMHDYVFIQFGHNDQKEYDSTRYAAPHGLYKQNLEKFITETKIKGAIPILFTSIARRKFDTNGKLIDTLGEYINVVKEVSKAMDVPMVDLNKLTGDYIVKLGDELSKELYLWVQPTDNYPKGKKDNTHLSEKGAKIVAKMAVNELLDIDETFKENILPYLETEFFKN